MKTVTTQALQKVALKVILGRNARKGCGRDMLGQPVPNTGSSSRDKWFIWYSSQWLDWKNNQYYTI